jgi:hypothetical protein
MMQSVADQKLITTPKIYTPLTTDQLTPDQLTHIAPPLPDLSWRK